MSGNEMPEWKRFWSGIDTSGSITDKTTTPLLRQFINSLQVQSKVGAIVKSSVKK